MDESKLKQFLVDCLYENDEEKCLVENELTDIIEEREKLEDLLEELKRNNLMIVEQSMLEEYKGLEALKEQDNSEIKQDDERLQILIESSAKNMLTLIQQKRNEINTDQSQLKILNNELTANSKTLNSLLNELEVLESKRLIEENRLFSSELKMANEFKSENDKLNFKLRKLEENLHKKLSQNVNAKNLIKPRICSLVGVYQGVQLFEADFNSNNPFNSESIGHRSNGSLILSNNETTTSNATNTLNSIDSISPLSSNYNANTINDFNSIIRTVKQKQPIGIKFNGCISKLLGVNINITESVLFSNRNKVIGSDEHYEYLIDIKINNPNQLVEQTEHWCISRRFKRIRSLHDQMCGLFPVLNCLVFPTRLVFNQSEKQLIERQCQLEHYLKCFIEILLNEPTCSIYYLFKNSEIVQSSTCDSLNSNQSSSIGFVDSASSFYTNNNLNYLSKHKLCSFCPFFQQTEFDKAYYMRKFNN